MPQDHDTAIHRRPDGSIDAEFYIQRAARLRSTAQKEKSLYWVVHLARAIGRGGWRKPKTPRQLAGEGRRSCWPGAMRPGSPRKSGLRSRISM